MRLEQDPTNSLPPSASSEPGDHLVSARRMVADCEGASTERAIELLQHAVAHFAAARLDLPDQWEYAEASRRLAELLVSADRLPEALQAYQEAVDAYERLPGGETRSRACARAIVEGGRKLHSTPERRLELLAAKYARQARQLEIEPHTERDRAELHFHLATVLDRRNRPSAALSEYKEALDLFEQAPETDLRRAACCERVAMLYHFAWANRTEAAKWYERALALYAAYQSEDAELRQAYLMCRSRLDSLTSSQAKN